ncbi:alpha-L-fucosidase [Acidipila rosea]|uniref:alpha-L-fucosidase n=1 Tax=Acidipila rosea TaxID=768535 RepID=A0A4V2PVK9_9BACT|nr:alpha-L-fucosidase [Acidipila rosea]MBW4043859.1 alpha-L-fucosidase [Acidobacteriota bacterium]TCK74161.1 alpha-L-fucosidase [Acidipila rosea]
MISLRSVKSSSIAIVTAAILAGCSLSAYSQQPTQDDLIWQKSVSKFDARRSAILAGVDKTAQSGPFKPDWNSLKTYKIPTWYQDAKFGIFIHWGVYSVPAFGSEWYPRLMYLQGTPEFKHEVATYGPQTKWGYKNFVPEFKAQSFDAKAWAALFKESGARYVIPVAEHHDGFQMYGSTLSDWNAVEMGPHRDIIGELATAIRAEGLHFGASSHRAEHYWFMDGGRKFPSDVQDPKYAAFYGPANYAKDPTKKGVLHPSDIYLNDWLARSAEIVEKYHPELVYFDWWVEQPEFQPYLKRFTSFYYNEAAARGQQPVLFRKNDAFPAGTTVLDIERGGKNAIDPVHWQTDTSVSNKSWGYVKGDTYKTPESLVWQLVDIVSKNGNLLLNIGPKPDGTIPEQAQSILRHMGHWLSVNGEAIYGTRPWTTYGEGPTKVVAGSFHDTSSQPFTPQDIRFTTKAGKLYAIALGWPTNGHLLIHSLNAASGYKVADVSLLGGASHITWKQQPDGLMLNLPRSASGKYAYSFRITPAAK